MKATRRFSFIILMAVNLVLILHAVLPHHHHLETVCFSESHCTTAAADNHDADCSDADEHRHDHDRSQTTCNLKTAFLMPHTSELNALQHIKELQKQNLVGISGDSPASIHKLDVNIQAASVPPVNLLLRFANTSRGLRGPPASLA